MVAAAACDFDSGPVRGNGKNAGGVAGSGGGDAGEGGAGGTSGGAAGVGVDPFEWCDGDDYCECASDCCGTRQVEPEYDSASHRWHCPLGYRDFAACRPDECPCDMSQRQESCIRDCCGNDDLMRPEMCIDGGWQCAGAFPIDIRACTDVSCPCESYLGYPGDRCDDAGNIVCAVDAQVMATACDGVVCQTCDGFTGPLEFDGCRCTCVDDDFVKCEPAPARPE